MDFWILDSVVGYFILDCKYCPVFWMVWSLYWGDEGADCC